MKSFIFVSVLIMSQAAMARELLIVKGYASAPKGSDLNALYAEAKGKARSQIPSCDYIQVSEWAAWVVSVGPQLYVGAKASFARGDEELPQTGCDEGVRERKAH